MTDFKEGDEVLVKATVRNVYDDGFFLLQFHGQERPSAHDDPYVTNLVKNAENTLTVEKPEMFPASVALDVNKELLEAANKATAYCEEIVTFGGKYGTLFGAIVPDARGVMRGLEEAIAAAEKGA
jgi:hypothetical protein